MRLPSTLPLYTHSVPVTGRFRYLEALPPSVANANAQLAKGKHVVLENLTTGRRRELSLAG